MILLSVGKKFSKFWLPVESGGDGIGYKFLTRKRIGKNSSITADWWRVFYHDMFGALESAVGWALGIAIAGGPVTLASYLVVIGFGGAASSIYAAM